MDSSQPLSPEEELILPPDDNPEHPQPDLDMPATEGNEDGCELPPDDNPEDTSGCNCKKMCQSKFTLTEIDNMRLEYHQLIKERDRMDKLFAAIKCQICDTDGNIIKGKHTWTLNGTVVCRSFWEHCHSAGHHTLDKFKQLIAANHSVLPDILPKMPAVSAGLQRQIADAFLLHLYNNVAQSYADDDAKPPVGPDSNPTELDPNWYEVIESSSHPLWTLSIAAGPDIATKVVPRKWLNPGTYESEIWQVYNSIPTDQKISKSTLYKVYKEDKWHRFMPFRGQGQGKRCKICAHIHHMMLQETTQEGKERVRALKHKHICDVKADRTINVRGNITSEIHAQDTSTVDGEGQLLKIQIDGMDQAKFKCPRNLVSPHSTY